MNTKIMTPSEEKITDGQIGKFTDRLRSKFADKKESLPSNISQDILEDKEAMNEILEECLQAFQKRVEARSNMIARTVKVNRNQTPQEALNAIDRKQYTNDSVVEAMPKGEGEEVTVYFFKVGKKISDEQLSKEYELRGLKAADPYSLAAVNQADPSFADEHPHGTHWKDGDGDWCYASFLRWRARRQMNVNRNGSDWDDHYWWFAGIRK